MSATTAAEQVQVLLEVFAKGFLVKIEQKESKCSSEQPYVKVQKYRYEWNYKAYEDILDVLFIILKKRGLKHGDRVTFKEKEKEHKRYHLFPAILFTSEFYLNEPECTLKETYHLNPYQTEAKCIQQVSITLGEDQKYGSPIVIHDRKYDHTLLKVAPKNQWMTFISEGWNSDASFDSCKEEIMMALKHIFPGTSNVFVQFKQGVLGLTNYAFTIWFDKYMKGKVFVFNSRKNLFCLEDDYKQI